MTPYPHTYDAYGARRVYATSDFLFVSMKKALANLTKPRDIDISDRQRNRFHRPQAAGRRPQAAGRRPQAASTHIGPVRNLT
jgi:hypothetical protein